MQIPLPNLWLNPYVTNLQICVLLEWQISSKQKKNKKQDNDWGYLDNVIICNNKIQLLQSSFRDNHSRPSVHVWKHYNSLFSAMWAGGCHFFVCWGWFITMVQTASSQLLAQFPWNVVQISVVPKQLVITLLMILGLFL